MIVNMHEAKTQLSRLVERAEAGEEVIIARNGKPAAKLVKAGSEMLPRVGGTMRGQIWISDDFDEEDPEIIAMFNGDDADDGLDA